MTKEEILDILDKNAATNRSSTKLAIGVGIAMVLGSTGMFIFMDKVSAWSYIIAVVGVAIIIGSVWALRTNKFEKDAQNIKDVFNNRPQDLVWSYTLEVKRNTGTTRQVIMKFRNGSQFEIEEDAVPTKNCNDLVQALTVINPEMTVGYSKETEKLYGEGKL